MLLRCVRYSNFQRLTSAMFFRPSTPSSEKDPLRFSKSLSFNADTGMILSAVEMMLIFAALLWCGYLKKIHKAHATPHKRRDDDQRETADISAGSCVDCLEHRCIVALPGDSWVRRDKGQASSAHRVL